MATKKKVGNAKAWEIGGAITAATLAAAAGAYLLTNKKTKTKAKAWVVNAKKEVVKHAKTAKKLGKVEYDRFVDQAVKQYGALENITAKDVVNAAKDLKAEWSNIQQHAQKIVKTVKSVKKSATKKPAARKAAAKPGTRKARA
jgi:hypothetical protein